MRKVLVSLLLTLSGSFLFGQEPEITARVIDGETRKPLKNVNIVVAGTTKGTVSNVLGFFKLSLPPKERKLVISHVSYETEMITVPEGAPSIVIPLRKAVRRIQTIRLSNYPTDLTLDMLKPIRESNELTIVGKDTLRVVEANAGFPFEGGTRAFREIFANQFQFPEKELLEGVKGGLPLVFTIDKFGKYTNVGCPADSLNAMCSEFKRMISQLPPWTPAVQRGEPMPQVFVIDIYYDRNEYWDKRAAELRKTKNPK